MASGKKSKTKSETKTKTTKAKAHVGVRSTAASMRNIQTRQEARDRDASRHGPHDDAGPGKKKPGVQAGARHQPDVLPAQHQRKPGHEADLRLAPQYLAPRYRGSGKLEGFSTIITGGDSGIGRAVAVLFAREGADVAIVYLSSHRDAKETKRAVENEGRECLLIAGDVKDAAFCRKAVKQTVKAFGKLDVLVNNAAYQQHAQSIADITEARLDLTIRTNIFGYFHMAQAALPYLKEGGSIINTGSETGLEGKRTLIDYSATKGAIHAFTKALAQNVLDQGIRVNCVAPGPVWTPLNPADSPAKTVAQFGMATMMHRPAQPEELSPAYVFLASPATAGYISGIVLPVTGHVGAI